MPRLRNRGLGRWQGLGRQHRRQNDFSVRQQQTGIHSHHPRVTTSAASLASSRALSSCRTEMSPRSISATTKSSIFRTAIPPRPNSSATRRPAHRARTSTYCGGNGLTVFYGMAKPVGVPLIGPPREPQGPSAGASIPLSSHPKPPAPRAGMLPPAASAPRHFAPARPPSRALSSPPRRSPAPPR